VRRWATSVGGSKTMGERATRVANRVRTALILGADYPHRFGMLRGSGSVSGALRRQQRGIELAVAPIEPPAQVRSR